MLSVNKLRTVIQRKVSRAIALFDMFTDGERVLVGLSGGADSLVLVDMLYEVSRRWQKNIQFLPVYVDAGFFRIPDVKFEQLRAFCESRGMSFSILDGTEIASIVEARKTRLSPCFTCSRMRRKILFEHAHKLGIKKIALGHHQDDLLATFFLNIIFSRRISAIKPVQDFFGGLFYIVRPMILVPEKYIKRYAKARNFPIVDKNCPYAGDTMRELAKQFLRYIERRYPGARKNIMRALFNPQIEYLWVEYKRMADRIIK